MSKTRKYNTDYVDDNFERCPSKNDRQHQKRLQRALKTKNIDDLLALEEDWEEEYEPDYE